MAAAMHNEALRRKQALDKQNWRFLSDGTDFSKYESPQATEPLKAARRAKTFSAHLNQNVQQVWWPFHKERPHTGCLKNRFSNVNYFTQW